MSTLHTQMLGGGTAAVVTKDITNNLIPTMTSNTAPSGIAETSDATYKQPYIAFNRVSPDINTGAGYWVSTTAPHWISYTFPSKQTINLISFQILSSDSITIQYKSGSNWIDIITFNVNSPSAFINKMITTGGIQTDGIRFISINTTPIGLAIGYVQCC